MPFLELVLNKPVCLELLRTQSRFFSGQFPLEDFLTTFAACRETVTALCYGLGDVKECGCFCGCSA